MSALGDYVHLKASNYAAHGTTQRGTYDSIGSYQDYVKKRTAAIKDINENTVNTLKNRLKFDSMEIERKDGTKSEKKFSEHVNRIYEILAEKTTGGMLGRYIGSSAWAYTGDYDALKGKALTEAEIDKKRVLVGSIHKLLDKVAAAGARGEASQHDLEVLVKQYNELSGKSIAADKSAWGIVQDDIDNYSYYKWISNVAGDFGEMLVAACQDTAEGAALDSFEEAMKGVVGGARSTITLDKSELARDLSQYGVTTDETGTQYKFGRTQDKVDVDIIVNGENVLATVKNYYDPIAVTLQSETSLLAALVQLNREGNYANHWLNAHAGRLTKSGDAETANKTLEFELAYEALVSGNPLKEGSQQANVFVILNRANGDAMIKSTRDVLTNELNKIRITPGVAGIRLKNRAAKEINDRIANVLMQVHQKNLHISYRVDSSKN